MARGITEVDVFKACDALLLDGARPTIERVRQKLGRGSPNTISPMLETWFKHLGARIKDPGAFAAPSGVADPVFQAAQHLWEVAQAEARRDVDDRVKDGLATAVANVEAEKERAAIAEASAFSANAKAAHLQTQVDQLLATLEAERIQHATTSARADVAEQRVQALRGEIQTATEVATQERLRADRAIGQADERAAAADRRAALEIDRERTLRTKSEKATEAIAKRFEAALKSEVSANEQLNAAQTKLRALQTSAAAREQELQAQVQQQAAKLQDLEASLAQARQAMALAATQETLVTKIIAELGSPSRRAQTGAATAPRSVQGARSKRKVGA